MINGNGNDYWAYQQFGKVEILIRFCSYGSVSQNDQYSLNNYQKRITHDWINS